jgi:RNA recognition motif-containing protein
LDFEETQYATEALTTPRNHSLNGRALVVEYASADAVRRGKIQRERETEGPAKNRSSRRPQKSERIAAKAAARKTILEAATTTRDKQEDAGQMDVSEPSQERSSLPGKNARIQKVGRNRTSRLKSGAALANAQRENVAIVEHTGKKIVFS